MKIALYYPWLHTKGGAERTILEHAKRSKHDITIYTSFYKPEATHSEFKDLKVIALNNKKLAKASYSEVFKACLRNLFVKIPLENYDLFLVHTGGFGELATLLNKKIPTAVYCHTILRGLRDSKEMYFSRYKPYIRPFVYASALIYAVFEKLAWKNFETVICNSENTKKRIAKAKLAKEPKEIHIAHPGVDVNSFKKGEKGEKGEKGKFDKYFLTVGRINFYKRTKLAIQAFNEFSKMHKGFKLIVAGFVSDKDKKYFEEVKTLASGNMSNIEFKISVSAEEILGLYKDCYACLFTAHDEDWGIVPLESMAAGKPIISVNEGGPKESVKNNETGFLVEPTPSAFAEKMKLLAENPKLAKNMGEAGRLEAKKYDWSIFAKQFDDFLNVIGEKKL